MDARKLIELLRATIDSDPTNRKQAEDQLTQVTTHITGQMTLFFIRPAEFLSAHKGRSNDHVLTQYASGG